MPTQRETPFTAWDFTDQELNELITFSPYQRQFFQTLLADTASAKLAEEFDGNEPIKFAQREAYSRGQMAILNYLLAEDFAAKIAVAVDTDAYHEVPDSQNDSSNNP